MNRVFEGAGASNDAGLHALVRDWSLAKFPRDEWPWLRRRFPDDLVVLLAYGRWAEYWMPRIPSAGPRSYGFMIGPIVVGTSHGRFGQEAFDAVSVLSTVVERAPDLVEARVRHGRVLWQLDRWDEAERELRHVLTTGVGGASEEWIYLAGFFLGQLLEERRRPVEARAAYEQAWAALPGQAVALRLIRLAMARGEDIDVASWLKNAARPDPWATYGEPQTAGEVGARFRDLRYRVRGER